MRAIIKGESGGNVNAKGLSGENGATQHMPEIWEYHSKMILGYVAPQTTINEQYVTAMVIQKWIDKGYSDYQIGLLYNGGSLKEKRGVNKFGAHYDTAAYAKKLVGNIAFAQQ